MHGKPIIQEANFSVDEGSKVTIMGQNGSGKNGNEL
jgi:ABC-type molybdenum transport system ATPase subunit/photorepair protein PhrA